MDDITLPCGQTACRPFNEACTQDPNQTPQRAAQVCSLLMAIDCLASEVDEQSTRATEYQLEAELMRNLAEKISVDQELGVLTFNSQKILYQEMEATGLLTRLASAGYISEMMFLDMDWLGGHNALGDHEGGDRALGKIVEIIRGLYRRKTDFIGVLGYHKEAEQSAEAERSFSQVGRYERGDEIVVMSFISPSTRKDDRRNPAGGLERRRDQIVEALDNKWIRYPVAKKKSLENIELDVAKKATGMIYRIEQGEVVTPVSAAFALVRHQVPQTYAAFEALVKVADANMAEAKRHRDGAKSRGAIANFLT